MLSAMRSPTILVLIALCAAVASADSDGKQSTWFRDYLAPSGAKTMSRYYGELDKKTVCYRQQSFCHMKCNNPVGNCALDTFTDTANLACTTCPEDLTSEHHYNSYHNHDKDTNLGIGFASTTLSKCFMHKVRHNPEDEVELASKPGVFMAGTFTGVCYLVEDDKCGLPEGCENTEVTITGVVYRIDNAVRIGPLIGGAPGTDIPNTCQGNTPNPIREGPSFDEPTRKNDAVVKPAAAVAAEGDVPVGRAYIYTGPFTVHSHSHPLKYNRGYFQFSFFSGTVDTPANTVTHLPRLGDETYKFEFISDATARY